LGEEKESGSKKKLTPTERLYLYLLDIDDIPESIQEEFWSLANRHIELTNISKRDVVYFKRRVRDIFRVAKWSRRRREFIPYAVEKQLEFLTVDILLRKSIDRGERELLATEIKELRTTDLDKAPPSKGIRATIGKIFGGGG